VNDAEEYLHQDTTYIRLCILL